jgi:polysaccharide pyruvyl transferase WcaK-like protein
MKILVENSAYSLENMGDLAMLQVGVNRLQDLFPDAKIFVLTQHPSRLRENCPSAIPMAPYGRDAWGWPLIDRFFYSSNTGFSQKWRALEKHLRYQQPQARNLLLKLKLYHSPHRFKEAEDFVNFMQGVDLVVATGGGYVTDAFIGRVPQKLETLHLAAKLGKPVVMLGQGIGPLNQPANYEKAQEVLPLVDMIALREGKTGLPLLQAINVPKNKIVVTGDDAVELAHSARPAKMGHAIGINLRVAKYSNVNQSCFDTLRSTLHTFAKAKDSELVPVPIERHSSPGSVESDADSIQKLLAGYDNSSDGGRDLDSPIKVIQQASRCRVVITGSYHAGVFALSQGIPIIGLARSQYYVNKFLGLSDQFRGGCKIVLLDSDTLSTDLETSLTQLWEQAEEMRPGLLDAASEQIAQGKAVYSSLTTLLGRKSVQELQGVSA